MKSLSLPSFCATKAAHQQPCLGYHFVVVRIRFHRHPALPAHGRQDLHFPSLCCVIRISCLSVCALVRQGVNNTASRWRDGGAMDRRLEVCFSRSGKQISRIFCWRCSSASLCRPPFVAAAACCGPWQRMAPAPN